MTSDKEVEALWKAIKAIKKRLGLSSGSPFVRTTSGSAGDVVGPSSSTDLAFARWDGTTGELLQDSTNATLDDVGRAVLKVLRIPVFDAGNSGTSKTIDWNNSNEQLLTLTGNVTLAFSNGDDIRGVLVLDTGAGSFTVTWPASVLWPGGAAPTITTTANKYDLVTLINLPGSPDTYIASINQDY